MKSVKLFVMESYHTDKVAFWFEVISFLLTVASSLSLAVTADAPDMRIVYPGFFLGSIAATYAYYRRKLALPMLLTTYFIVINIIGFCVAMGWSI